MRKGHANDDAGLSAHNSRTQTGAMLHSPQEVLRAAAQLNMCTCMHLPQRRCVEGDTDSTKLPPHKPQNNAHVLQPAGAPLSDSSTTPRGPAAPRHIGFVNHHDTLDGVCVVVLSTCCVHPQTSAPAPSARHAARHPPHTTHKQPAAAHPLTARCRGRPAPAAAPPCAHLPGCPAAGSAPPAR